jgi:hypothetical protein
MDSNISGETIIDLRMDVGVMAVVIQQQKMQNERKWNIK